MINTIKNKFVKDNINKDSEVGSNYFPSENELRISDDDYNKRFISTNSNNNNNDRNKILTKLNDGKFKENVNDIDYNN